jgi:hypothetical protein
LDEDADRVRAAEKLVRGEIIASAFNGIYVLLGDADDPSVPEKVASAKGRPQAKGVALVCPPEFFGEHIDLEAAVLRENYPFPQVQALLRALHALWVILPGARCQAHQRTSPSRARCWTSGPSNRRPRRSVSSSVSFGGAGSARPARQRT